MDGFVSQLLIGAGNVGIGFAVGWLFRGSRMPKQAQSAAGNVNPSAILEIVNAIESSAFAQARSWAALRRALGQNGKKSELRGFARSNECYRQLLDSHESQLNRLDPDSQVVSQGLKKSLAENQRGVRGLSGDLRGGNESQVDVEQLLKRLERLEASNHTLCEELVVVRLKAAEQSMELERTRSAALEDFLTKLPNRRAFDRRFAEANATFDRNSQPFCLALIDLDDFKQINDSYGHEAGDSVLSVTGRVLSDTCRSSDFVARFGGEEFVVLMPDSDLEGARILCERIRAKLEATVVRHERQSIRVTCSIGLAQAGPGGLGQTLLRLADELLYTAKSNGRNRVCDSISEEPNSEEPTESEVVPVETREPLAAAT